MPEERDYIVSLTSYPDRIKALPTVIESVISQISKPDTINLYLSSDEFKDSSISLDCLKQYENFGLRIIWVTENLRAHKKYYYAFQRNENKIVITIDDDMIYPPDTIKELLYWHDEFPKAVIARRAHLILGDEKGEIIPYNDWEYNSKRIVGQPRKDLFATGVGGVLYPRGCVDGGVFDLELIRRLCPNADDIWLKIHEILNGTPVVLTDKEYLDEGIAGIYDNGLSVGINSGSGNENQLRNVLAYYNSQLELPIEQLIFQDGMITREDLKNELIDSLKSLYESIGNMNSIIVFGAGTVAKRVYKYLNCVGMERRIISFVVECKDNNPNSLFEKPVMALDDMRNDSNYLIALWNKGEALEIMKRMMYWGIKTDQIRILSDEENEILKRLDTL